MPPPLPTARVVIAQPVQAFLDELSEFYGIREESGNRGLHADFFNWYTIRDMRPFPLGGQGAPWCASSLYTIGRLALGVGWPIPRMQGGASAVQAVAEWAEKAGVVVETPEPGDLLCLWRGTRFGHIAVVTHVPGDGTVRTIEGNTNDAGSAEGVGVFRLTRPVRAEDRFVRWTRLLV